MKFKLYTVRINIFIIVFTLLIQSLYMIAGVVNYYISQKKIYESQISRINHYYLQNINLFSQSIHDYIAALKSTGVFEYTAKYNNLIPAEKAAGDFQKLNYEVSRLTVTDRFVKGFYVLGSDKNQKSYAKLDGETTDIDFSLSNDDIKSSGIGDYLLLYYQTFFLFDRSLVPNKLSSYKPEVEDFLNRLDGNIIYTFLSSNSYCVLIINKNTFSEMFSPVENIGGFVSIINSKGKVIFHRGAGTAADDTAALNAIGISEANKKSIEAAINSRKGELHLDLTFSGEFYNRNMIWVSCCCLFVFLLFLSFAVFLGKYFSNAIVRPYKSLNGIMRFLYKDTRLDEINIEEIKPAKKRTSIKRQIFYAAVLAVLIPSVVSGVVYASILSYFSTKNLKSFTVISQRQSTQNVIEKIENILKSGNVISADELNDLKHYNSGTSADSRNFDQVIANNIQKLSEFNYYLITDNEFRILYQANQSSGFSEYSAVLKAIRKKTEFNPNDLSIITIKETASATDSLILTSRIRTAAGEASGYVFMFVNPNLFNGINMESISEFIIKNSEGETIAQSPSNYEDFTLGSGKGIITKTNIPYDGWTLYTYVAKEMFLLESNRLFQTIFIYTLSICLLAVIFAWMFSFYFVSPLENIQEYMNNGSEINAEYLEDSSSMDEIGQVITAYNKMIRQINILMKEKIFYETREQELRALKTRAELEALQRHINPHFLYNTLELVNLQSLKSGDYKISDIIVALTKIFRYSTGSLDARVTLENELEHVRNYMMIQGYRFEGKYDFEFDIAPETLSCEILRLTLQPIVENAILHGLSEYSENCKIVVKAYISDGYLYIKITDNGVGISAADLERLMYNIKNGEGESIGLKNVYKRLKLVWDDEADLNIESKLMKGTTVTIKIKAQSLSKDI